MGKRSKTASRGAADAVSPQVIPFSARSDGSCRRPLAAQVPVAESGRPGANGVQPFRERLNSCTAKPTSSADIEIGVSHRGTSTAPPRVVPPQEVELLRALDHAAICVSTPTVRPRPRSRCRAGLSQKWRSSTVRRRTEPAGAPGVCAAARPTGVDCPATAI